MGNKQPKLTPAEQAKKQKRIINKSIRELEREQKNLQKSETKFMNEMKKLAQKNQHVSLEKTHANFRVLQKSWLKISFDLDSR